MRKYWDEFTTYAQPSAAELQHKAKESIAKAKSKGRKYVPLHIKNRRGAICTSWWGNSWCKNLEGYADYASRLERGRRYVRSGAVIDLQIVEGHVMAKVQGSRRTPYNIDIKIGRLSEEACQDIMDRCSCKTESLEKLIRGEFPDELKDVFTGRGGLFPTPREISFNCSCPDWAIMCKHVAAVMYGIGVRFDENPFFFFTLRGVDADKFVGIALENRVERMLSNFDCHSSRIIEGESLKDIFGI